MIRFVIRRLLAVIPTVLGISLVTFVVVNVSMSDPETGDSGGAAGSAALASDTAEELGRTYGLHLPLFVNLAIEDVRTRTERDIERLSDAGTRGRAERSLARTGGAILPYLVPALPKLKGAARESALDILDDVARRIDLDQALEVAPDRSAFWTRYWSVYGSDFTPVRAARLVRRMIRRDDQLALTELRRLDTYCLPQLLEALSDEIAPAAQGRIVALACELTGRDDQLDPGAPALQREIVVARWHEWWRQRYDLYTAFEGIGRVTGAVTETRYFRWLSRVLTLDFGTSVRDGRSVRAKLASARLVLVIGASWAWPQAGVSM